MISFVIPACQEEDQIPLTIRSILQNNWDSRPEIIVVENGSTDRTAEAARNAGAIVHTLPQKSRSLARNYGASIAKGEWLVFLDADVILDPYWSQGFYKALKNSWFEIIQGPIVPEGKRNYLNQFRKNHVSGKTEGTYCSFISRNLIPVLNSACFVIRKKTFLQLGGFDLNLPRCEDIDLGFRGFFEGLIFAVEPSMKSTVHWNHGFLAYLRRFYAQGKSLRKLEMKWSMNLASDGSKLLSLQTIKEEYGVMKLAIHFLQWLGWKEESFGSAVLSEVKTAWPYRLRGRNSKLPLLWGWKEKWKPLSHTRFLFTGEDLRIFYLNETMEFQHWTTPQPIQNLEEELDRLVNPGGFQRISSSS